MQRPLQGIQGKIVACMRHRDNKMPTSLTFISFNFSNYKSRFQTCCTGAANLNAQAQEVYALESIYGEENVKSHQSGEDLNVEVTVA